MKKQGKLTAAIESYTRALKLDPASAAGLYNRGLAFQVAGNTKKSLTDLSKAIDLAPGSADALIARGAAFEADAQPEKAYADYEAALRWAPDNPLALRNRGRLLFKRKNVTGACKDFARAHVLSPNHAKTMWFLGQCKEFEGDQSMADQYFAHAIALQPALAKYREYATRYRKTPIDNN